MAKLCQMLLHWRRYYVTLDEWTETDTGSGVELLLLKSHWSFSRVEMNTRCFTEHTDRCRWTIQALLSLQPIALHNTATAPNSLDWLWQLNGNQIAVMSVGNKVCVWYYLNILMKDDHNRLWDEKQDCWLLAKQSGIWLLTNSRDSVYSFIRSQFSSHWEEEQSSADSSGICQRPRTERAWQSRFTVFCLYLSPVICYQPLTCILQVLPVTLIPHKNSTSLFGALQSITYSSSIFSPMKTLFQSLCTSAAV